LTSNNIENYRKISRDFKYKIRLMNKIPVEDSISLFFEMCNINLENYIIVEKQRFPTKSTKEIILNMHKKRDTIKKRKFIYGK